MNTTMFRPSRLVLLAVLIAPASLLVRAQQGAQPAPSATPAPGPVAILYPSDRVVLTNEKLAIVAVAPAGMKHVLLKLDGKPLESERMTFAPVMALRGTRLYATTRPSDIHRAAIIKDAANKALWVAGVALSPGQHIIEAEGAVAHVFAASPDAKDTPAGWEKFNPHGYTKNTIVNACDQCHEVEKNGSGRILGVSNMPDSCSSCHNEVDVQLTHRHVLDSLSKCYLCHDPHGAPGTFLLVDTQERLCTQCHEGGHSKR